MHIPEHARDLLPVPFLLELRGDDLGKHEHDRAARGYRLVRERLGVGEGDRVVDELDRFALSESRELSEDGGCGEDAVEDVRGAERGEEGGVVRGGGGDYGREVGELRDLDGWVATVSLGPRRQ